MILGFGGCLLSPMEFWAYQFKVLHALMKLEWQDKAQVMGETGLASSTVGNAFNELRKQGFVEKAAHRRRLNGCNYALWRLTVPGMVAKENATVRPWVRKTERLPVVIEPDDKVEVEE